MQRLLLDTHVLLSWLADDPISPQAAAAIAEPTNEVFVSAASIWEATIKAKLSTLDIVGSLADATDSSGFASLAITAAHAEQVGALPDLHRDPFVRLLIAQAVVESLTIVTRDQAITAYGLAVLEA